MLVVGVFTWEDIIKYAGAWNTLAWFATLVTLADGLNKVGFVKWFAEMAADQLGGVAPIVALIVLLAIFFFSHYMFASVTAHTTAMLPVMLAAGSAIPGMPIPQYALLLCVSLGIAAKFRLRRWVKPGLLCSGIFIRDFRLGELRRDLWSFAGRACPGADAAADRFQHSPLPGQGMPGLPDDIA
jgi:hypothetical protein